MTAPNEPDLSTPDPGTVEDLESGVDERLALRNAFSETLAANGFDDILVLSRERAKDVFHERRLEILDALRVEEPQSVRELAGLLGYDKGVVSRDLRRLARIDVIEYEERGRSKAPRLTHRHVALKPVV